MLLTAVDIQLIAHYQPTAAALRQLVVTLVLCIALGVCRRNREQGIVQVVMRRQHLVRAIAFTGAERDTLLEVSGPGFPLARRDLTVSDIGKIKQGDAIISRQHNHRLTHQLLIKFHANGQGHIKKVFFEVRRQTFGLGQKTAGCRAIIGRSQCTCAEHKGERSRDGSHREHERILGVLNIEAVNTRVDRCDNPSTGQVCRMEPSPIRLDSHHGVGSTASKRMATTPV
ncbi:hypothetical protein D3C73_878950 [compost metagenome]